MAIIGAGPAGTLLSHLLDRAGIDSVVARTPEPRARAQPHPRRRAGVGFGRRLRDAGVGARMDAEGQIHDGAGIAWAGRDYFFIDIKKHTGLQFMAYGQTMIQEDLYLAREAAGGQLHFEASDVRPHDVTTGSPYVTYVLDGTAHRIDCDFVVGCDGYHGVSRTVIPPDVIHTYEKEYPFGWLGILSETPPLHDLVYCNHARGFALASQRNPMLSRYYVQCPLDDSIDDWPDERFWSELTARLPPFTAEQVVTGPSIEKSIAPLRSFVAEPMRFGNLFLAGDAAHIVPPTGAKGLNLAISDVYYLSRGLVAALRRPRRSLPRPLLGDGAAARLGRGAVLVVAHEAAPPFPRPDRVRPARPGGRARLPRLVGARPGVCLRAVRRPALRGLTAHDSLALRASPSAHCWRNLPMPRWRISPVPGIFGENEARQRMVVPPFGSPASSRSTVAR